MANTPQAKKRIRRNANRAAINGARVSRIRTFIKAVESAIAAGKKDDAADALKQAQPEMARGVARGRDAQEYRVAEVLAPDQAGRFARLSRDLSVPVRNGPSERSGGPFHFDDCKKVQHFPRFVRFADWLACWKNGVITAKFNGFRRLPLSSRFISLL